MLAHDAALALGASMRLTRLVVTDDLGEWFVKEPVRRWTKDHPRHLHWAEGLDCPFCVGYWIGVAVLLGYHALPRGLWRFGCATLTLNEVAGHLAARLGDTAE